MNHKNLRKTSTTPKTNERLDPFGDWSMLPMAGDAQRQVETPKVIIYNLTLLQLQQETNQCNLWLSNMLENSPSDLGKTYGKAEKLSHGMKTC